MAATHSNFLKVSREWVRVLLFSFSMMKAKVMVLIAFNGAMFLACDTELTEDTDDLKSGLTQPGMYDPDYVEERLTELAIEYGPRIDPEESFWPALGLVSIHYCLCEYCKGGKVESICLR